jgi:hypothetical protein
MMERHRPIQTQLQPRRLQSRFVRQAGDKKIRALEISESTFFKGIYNSQKKGSGERYSYAIYEYTEHDIISYFYLY